MHRSSMFGDSAGPIAHVRSTQEERNKAWSLVCSRYRDLYGKCPQSVKDRRADQPPKILTWARGVMMGFQGDDESLKQFLAAVGTYISARERQ